MTRKCQVCREPVEGTQVVIYNKENNTKTGYLAIDESVLFDSAKIAKFLYFCATRGLRVKNHDILDLCPGCMITARIELN